MCVIAVGKKKAFNKEWFVSCCKSNPDGFYLLRANTGANIRTLRFEEAEAFFDDSKDEDDIVLHARIKSVGEVNENNIHGWKHGDISFCHNGTLNISARDGMTDSETFFRDIFIPIYDAYGREMNDKTSRAIDACIGSSKFCFIKGNKVFLFGAYQVKGECKFSNLFWDRSILQAAYSAPSYPLSRSYGAYSRYYAYDDERDISIHSILPSRIACDLANDVFACARDCGLPKDNIDRSFIIGIMKMILRERQPDKTSSTSHRLPTILTTTYDFFCCGTNECGGKPKFMEAYGKARNAYTAKNYPLMMKVMNGYLYGDSKQKNAKIANENYNKMVEDEIVKWNYLIEGIYEDGYDEDSNVTINTATSRWLLAYSRAFLRMLSLGTDRKHFNAIARALLTLSCGVSIEQAIAIYIQKDLLRNIPFVSQNHLGELERLLGHRLGARRFLAPKGSFFGVIVDRIGGDDLKTFSSKLASLPEYYRTYASIVDLADTLDYPELS